LFSTTFFFDRSRGTFFQKVLVSSHNCTSQERYLSMEQERDLSMRTTWMCCSLPLSPLLECVKFPDASTREFSHYSPSPHNSVSDRRGAFAHDITILYASLHECRVHMPFIFYHGEQFLHEIYTNLFILYRGT
jgi:hypothetical protein